MCGPDISDISTLNHDYRRLRAIAVMAPIAMFEANVDGTVSWANDMWCELLCLSENEALEKLWFESVHPDDLLQAVGSWDSATMQHIRVEFECRIVGPNKTIRWVHFKGAPILDPATGTTSYVVTGMDMTNKRRLDEILLTIGGLENWAEIAAAELAQKDREMELFATLVQSNTDAIAIAVGDLSTYLQLK